MGLKRNIDPTLLAAMSGPGFEPVTLVFVDWPDAPVRVHSGVGNITWSGETWVGVGPLNGLISLPAEGLGLGMVEGQAKVGGDPDRIDEVLGEAEDARGATVQVWFGAVTKRCGTVLIGEPFSAFTGTLGAVEDEDAWLDDTTALRQILAGLESGPSQRSSASIHHSYEDQRRTDPTDTAGRWVIGALASAVREIPKW